MQNSELTWRRRHDRAAAFQDDSSRIRNLARAARDMGARRAPLARAIAAEERLRSARRVGVLAGSFNPLTIAHEALAEAARAQGELDAVLWTCAVVTVDKEHVARATLVDRLCQLAALSDSTERDATLLVNHGLYADQARLVKALLHPSAEVSIVVGFDKVAQIFDQRYYDDREAALTELFASARLLVAPRGGHSAQDLSALLTRPENARYADRVSYVEVPEDFSADSSSEARRLAGSSPKRAEALRALLTPEGEALTELGPYARVGHGEVDAYGWRARWEGLLANWPDDAQLPGMNDLVAATISENPVAAEIRRRLERPSDAANLRELGTLIGQR